MTVSPAAVATARRNVVQRIERFLNGLERARRPPNRRELYHLREALQKLEAGQYPEGEDAMLKGSGGRCPCRSGKRPRVDPGTARRASQNRAGEPDLTGEHRAHCVR